VGVVTQVLDEKPMVVCGVANGGVSNGLAVKPLSPEQEELINRLVYFQEEFDQPSEEDLRKISVRNIKSFILMFKKKICNFKLKLISKLIKDVGYSRIGRRCQIQTHNGNDDPDRSIDCRIFETFAGIRHFTA
jgi:hypothetical protein